MDDPKICPPRILALCIGEASWDFLKDPSFADHIPFLKMMEANGARGTTLASQPLTFEASWATVVTGRSPSAHGIYGPAISDSHGAQREVSAKDLLLPPIWTLMEDAGVPTGVFNSKFVDLSQEVLGFRVSHDASPEINSKLVQPLELYSRLTKKIGHWTTTTRSRTKHEWISLVPDEIETRNRVIIESLRTQPWKFSLVHFSEVAKAQHRFLNDGTDTLKLVYAAVDQAMAQLAEEVGPETIIFVFSECGAGPIRHAVQLNAWLEQQGYLVRKQGLIQKLGFSFARAYQRFKRHLPKFYNFSMLKIRTRGSILASSIDWSRTQAFCPTGTSEIVLNASEQDRGALAEKIRRGLLALRDPEDRRVVEDVIVNKSSKTTKSSAPDLIVVWEDDAYMPTEVFDGKGQIFVDWCPQFKDWKFTGSHRRKGIFLASGPGIQRFELDCIQTVDLVPTWLDMHGVVCPPELEGSSIAAKLYRR